jgi:hypothetical protein
MDTNNTKASIREFRKMFLSSDPLVHERAFEVLGYLEENLLDLWEAVQFSYGFENGWAIEPDDKDLSVSDSLMAIDRIALAYFKKIGATK